MGIERITERHAAQIEGVLGCWDRMLVFGTLPKICYAEGMTSHLFANHVRIFDYPGFNRFDPEDDALFRVMVRGEFNISGLQNKTLRRHLPDNNSGQVSRLLKRLRTHGLIKKVGRTYKYYLTQFGKDVVATGLKLRELVIIPQLAFGHLA